jgi:hypothetical protein
MQIKSEMLKIGMCMKLWANRNDYIIPSPTFFLPPQVSGFEGYVFRLFLFIFIQEDDACLVHVECYTDLVPSFLKLQFYDGYGQNMKSESMSVMYDICNNVVSILLLLNFTQLQHVMFISAVFKSGKSFNHNVKAKCMTS